MLLVLPAIVACERAKEPAHTQVIVLGFDGFDYTLCKQLLGEGRLPHLSKLAAQGSFHPLTTSIPPQSPVAWSNLITGTNSGRHGVFDFIHRDPLSGAPFSSAATHLPPSPLPIVGNSIDELSLLGYKLPLRSASLKINRHAPAFWDNLTSNGVETHIFKMPANYPPEAAGKAHFCCLSDMGTPDMVDSLGTFAYYTSDPAEQAQPLRAGGGRLYLLTIAEHQADGLFRGPRNSMTDAGDIVQVPFSLLRDPENEAVVLRYQDQVIILNEGEWSDWHPISFELLPHLTSLSGMCRFYAKESHPHLKLYVSPFNFDPKEESWEIDQPSDWSAKVADAVGRYYTQGLPEDTKALSNGVLTRDEFLQQAELVYEERMRLLNFAMDHFESGLLFFYFGSADQVGHMFWAAQDPAHPAISNEERRKYAGVMKSIYEKMDAIVGKVSERFPDATLMVLSDHGFTSYRRTVNLNTWLEKEGFARPRNPADRNADFNFDFSRSKAYALGVNSLYVNLSGREASGIVEPADKQRLIDDLTRKLLAFRDPETGDRVVDTIYQCDRVFDGPMTEIGPDLIVGYAAGYGGGGVLGRFPKETIIDNTDAWCGDHCVAAHLVPGVLFSNRPITAPNAELTDIAPAILGLFNVATPPYMEGQDLFSTTPTSRRGYHTGPPKAADSTSARRAVAQPPKSSEPDIAEVRETSTVELATPIADQARGHGTWKCEMRHILIAEIAVTRDVLAAIPKRVNEGDPPGRSHSSLGLRR